MKIIRLDDPVPMGPVLKPWEDHRWVLPPAEVKLAVRCLQALERLIPQRRLIKLLVT